VAIEVVSYTKGDLLVTGEIGPLPGYEAAPAARLGIDSTGTYWYYAGTLEGDFQFLHIEALEDTDLIIRWDTVKLYDLTRLNTFSGIAGELLANVDHVSYSGSTQSVGWQTGERPVRRTELDRLCADLLIDYYTDTEGFLRFVPWPIVDPTYNSFGSHAPVAVLDH